RHIAWPSSNVVRWRRNTGDQRAQMVGGRGVKLSASSGVRQGCDISIQQELRLGQTEEDARHYSTIVPQSVTSQLKPSIPAKDPRPKKKMPEIRQPVDTAVSNDSPQGDRLLETTVFVFRRASQSAHVRDQQRTEVRSADRRALTHHSQHHRVVLGGDSTMPTESIQRR
ncbi:hypothetical protein ACFL2H_12070, partial [Planctomycetota bacterium]